MDALDQKLLGLLRLNARESVVSLAAKLRTSRSTVQDRLRRLEQGEVIRGYTVDLGEPLHANQIRALVTVQVEPQKTSDIVSELKTFYQINAIHTVSGKFDLVIEISSDRTEDIDRLLDKVCEIPGVGKTESFILLSTKLQR